MITAAFIAYLTYYLDLHPGWYWAAGLMFIAKTFQLAWGMYKAGKASD